MFHLVYTESSTLFESHIVDILRGLRTGDLGDLSPSQFRPVIFFSIFFLDHEASIYILIYIYIIDKNT